MPYCHTRSPMSPRARAPLDSPSTSICIDIATDQPAADAEPSQFAREKRPATSPCRSSQQQKKKIMTNPSTEELSSGCSLPPSNWGETWARLPQDIGWGAESPRLGLSDAEAMRRRVATGQSRRPRDGGPTPAPTSRAGVRRWPASRQSGGGWRRRRRSRRVVSPRSVEVRPCRAGGAARSVRPREPHRTWVFFFSWSRTIRIARSGSRRKEGSDAGGFFFFWGWREGEGEVTIHLCLKEFFVSCSFFY